MQKTKFIAYVALWLGSVLAAAAQGNAPLTATGWVSARIRKTVNASNVVESQFNLANRTRTDFENVVVQISYQDAEAKELKLSDPLRVGRLGAGSSKDVILQTGWTPAFETYEIRVSYTSGGVPQRAQWFGRGSEGQPVWIPPEPLAGDPQLVVIGDAFWVDDPNGPLQGVVRMRNLSATPVEQLAVKVVFLESGSGRQLGTWRGPMGDGRLGAGGEKISKLSIPNAPKKYGAYSVEFSYAVVQRASEFARWSGGEFGRMREVEAGKWDFQRSEKQPDDLVISALIRNSTAESVNDVTLTLKFLKKDGGRQKLVRELQVTFREEILPGQTQAVSAVVTNFRAPFDDIVRELSYQVRQAAPSASR